MSKPHVCTPESCPEPGKYFVTATGDNGAHFWLMAGPYNSHGAALAKVKEATNIACDKDGRAWFMSWGTARMPDDSKEIGKLQKVGLMPPTGEWFFNPPKVAPWSRKTAEEAAKDCRDTGAKILKNNS